MSRTRFLLITSVLAVLSAIVAAGPALAGAPGKWTQVTGPNRNIDEVGLARTGDGMLHVLWKSEVGLGGTVQHSAVSADAGTVTGPHAVFSYPNGVNHRMALIAQDGGLRAFFSGLMSSESEPLQGVMATATSADGVGWSVKPNAASNDSPGGRSAVYVASGIGAALGAGNTPISAWGDSGPGEAGYHFGVGSGDADHRYSTECCVYAPGVGVDSVTGQAWLAWQFLHNSGNGTAYQSISPLGERTVAPGAAAADGSSRTAISGRIGGDGVFLGYLRGTNQFLSVPAVVRVGTTSTIKFSKESGARLIGIAPAPAGRMWLFWMRKNVLYATRSNGKVNKFGAIVRVKAPKGTTAVYNLAGEGSLGPLDMVTLAETSTTIDNWHQRVLPGLTIKGKSGKGKVKVTVTDAGDPVKGAKVKIGKKSKKTGSKGTVTFSLSKGKYKAKASKNGYTAASKTVKAG